ncbi:MAG TPA: transketolase [Ignavibacteriaceae bacterium]|nr:transketolase [Ignavibacteriaceae bacterium]
MSIFSNHIDELAVNTIRLLAADGVQKAKSGHPGMPMGCAPIAYVLYSKYIKHNPANPKWANRDRFILSAGHGSMLLYSILHLCGYDLSIDDLKNFRQWGSKTPGHPENTHTPGVEVTTGPLGQGFANAVGIALAEKHFAEIFNKDDLKLIDHYVYGICSDGDLMEGVSHEAASFAGHLKLGNLIFFYDDNQITIDGSTELSFSDKTAQRFEAYNWHVQTVNDVNDIDALEKAITAAQNVKDKPSLIVTKTHIGFGSPNKQDSSEAHGSALGDEEVKLTKKNLGWDENKFFYVPDEVYKAFADVKSKGAKLENDWNDLRNKYAEKYPEDAKKFEDFMSSKYREWEKALPKFELDEKGIATRVASGKTLNAIASYLPGLIGGSADLTPSNNTHLKDFDEIKPGSYKGRNIHFGIREHGMASILNGMALYGGFIPFGATFLIFSDYLRPAIRLGALSKIKVIYVFTHDSIGLGEDGPTHQPIEQLASLRAIPNVVVVRPADANETVYAWKAAIKHKESPFILALTRQNLPTLDLNKYNIAEGVERGAYILKDSEGTPELILMASGSEVSLALKAGEKLEAEGMKVRVVSFPSWQLFEKQSEEYKKKILPSSVTARLSIEAGVELGWSKYTGVKGASISIEKFGSSAPDKILFEKYGFTVDNVYAKAKELLRKS